MEKNRIGKRFLQAKHLSRGLKSRLRFERSPNSSSYFNYEFLINYCPMKAPTTIGYMKHLSACGLFAVILTCSPLAQAQSSVIYSDNFEGTVSGWSINNTDFDADLTRFLGRFDNNPTTTSRSFTIPAGADRVEIEFDFYRIDSWDNTARWGFDRFQIEVDNTQLFSLPFSTYQSARSGVTGNVSWSHTPLAPASHLAFTGGASWYQDQIHRVVLIVESPGTTLDLDLRTALNQGGGDESGGYDNIIVTAFFPEPDVNIVKTVEPAIAGDYNLPGNDMRYVFTLTSDGAAIDAGSITLVDNLPLEVSLFTGDLNGSGQPVVFSDNSMPASGLSCCTAANIEFSDTTTGVPIFGYVPATPYDPDVTYLRITPSGGIRSASTDPVEVEFTIQTKIH